MIRFTLSTLLVGLIASAASAQDPKESDYYKISNIAVPDGVVFEVSGIDFLPDKKVAVCSRRGDVYIIENAFDAPGKQPKWTLFAEGLHEPLGLSYHKGWLWATTRAEVTKMKDVDGDGRADIFRTVSDGWGINGDYHEYAFGSRHDKDGNIWIVLCLTGSGGASSDFRGWCVRVNEKGEMIPTASGIRSPGGIGNNHLGDMFYCDNQGLWNGSSSIKHIQIGSFLGNPTGNKYYELTKAIGPRPVEPKSGSRIEVERKRVKELLPPACVLPHGKLGKSSSGIEPDTSGGKFGPFSNQLFVQDQGFSNLVRLDLEKVNGIYQGAAFHFLKGFGSGNIAMRMNDDGSLFVGGTNRGWGSVGKKPFALERVNWTGKVPFEVHTMRIQPGGFKLTFTHEVDPKTVGDIASYSMAAYTYIYQKGYGSPQVDKTVPKVTATTVGADKKSVVLKVNGLVKGNVHELHMKGIRSAKALPLLHPAAYYTLNEFPKP
jgi:hypothetical protein